MIRVKPDPIVRPPLKWVGSKRFLLPELLKRMPKTFGTYFEPFVGGGALFFALSPRFHVLDSPAILSDRNGDLIGTYRALAAMSYEIGAELQKMQAQHYRSPRGTYERIRKIWNASRWTPVRSQPYWAASFLYLNRTCFNGLYRVNAAGDFNVPIGKYTKPKIWDQKLLDAAASALGKATLYEKNYQLAMIHPEVDDFVYFDPPYDPISKTASFRSYTSSGFGESDQRELAAIATKLAKRGVKVMLSNSDTPLIRKLYKDKVWTVDRVMVPRRVSSKGSTRGKVAEVIITGGYRRSRRSK